ncbi:MAG TPA: OmpA family protein [Candidatus Limnocylindria bacterium]|nr:OmpA family protein [Candidatus Limnocylindria bacterium]
MRRTIGWGFACAPLLLFCNVDPARAANISGTVFEDLNYGGGAGRSMAASAGVVRSGARVELYGSGGAFSSFATTNGSGVYTFTGLGAGTYFVRVVNGSVSSSRSGYVAGTHLPVQTFRTSASSGAAVAVTDFVGGTDPSVTDPGDGAAGTTMNTVTFVFTAGLSGTAQSVTRVVLGAPDIGQVDFGFNFNTIVNTNPTGQGSLRQFLTNAGGLSNAGLAIAGQPAATDVSIFMISDGLAHPGLRAGLPNLLDGSGVAVITPATALPAVADASTSLDGTTQTANVGNTNPLVFGAGATVGVAAVALPQVAGPEVAIRDVGALTNGIEIAASNVTVRGFAIHGFGNSSGEAGILVGDNFVGTLIENNLLGTTASSFTDPGAGLRNLAGLFSNGGDSGTIRNNLIGFSGVTGIYFSSGSTNWSVYGNEIRDIGTTSSDGDGVTISGASANDVRENLIVGSSSQAIVVTAAGASGNSFTNNTVTGNGVGTPTTLVQSPGATMRSGAASTTLDRNVIRANYGAGVQINNGAIGTRLTGNSIDDNGTIVARTGAGPTGQIGIDLNAAADNQNLGTAPFFTLNDAGDLDVGGNDLQNFPTLSSARRNATQITIQGTLNSAPSTTYRIEFFASATADPSGYGEGERYLGFTNVTTDVGGDATINTTLAAIVAAGEAVTATATDPANNTSEFAANATASDLPGITLSRTSGLVTTEAGGTDTFTVVLTSPPTANVTIPLSSNDLSEGTVSPASVTFTPANWATPRIVTATGVNDDIDDGNVVFSVVTASANSTDADYNSINPPNVSVTNQDDDTAGITVIPTSGLITTEVGGTATFTIVLNSEPTANVTIGLSSSDLTEGTVAPPSVTFTNGNWSTAQTVTITGVDDLVADGNIVYSIVTAAATSGDGGYNGRNAADVGVTNQDNDVVGVTVSPTAGLVTTEAGGQATFTIVLTSEPTADVTIGLSSSDLTEGTVAPASVTFTNGNWSTAQTVTITGVNDAVDDGDIAYSILTAAATSADAGYNGFDPADAGVTNQDDDAVGITVIPTAGLVTTEAGGQATFTIVLNSQPTANVTIGLSSSDLTEGTVAPASVTFTNGDWSTAQTVTITGVNDAIDDGDIAYSILTAAAASADAGYNGLDAVDVAVTNQDNDAVGITVNPTAGLVTTEAGGQATFTVVLTSQPTADVTVGLSSTDLTEGTVAPASVTFTNGNWSTAQTVTVTGVDDLVADGDIAYSIVTAAATSADAGYNGINPADVAVTNQDNDVVGVTVNPTAGLVTTEAGGQATFTVVLTSQPSADVTIGLSSSDLTEGTVTPASVTFNNGNWSIAQTVTITGVDDAVADGNIVYSIVTAPATSADAGYNGFNPPDAGVTNQDDDNAGVTVTPVAGLTTTEALGQATFTIVLNSQPTADVTIGLSSSDLTEGTVAPASVTFNTGNWSVAQTVTVTGVDDPAADGNIAYSIVTAAATSADAGYNGLDATDVAVTNQDNDVVGIAVNPTAGLVTTEALGQATFTVVLVTQPTANVTIGLSSSDLTEGTVAPASVTFTNGDWSTAQTVTVTGVNDDLDDGDILYSILTAAATSADAGYNGLDAANVGVTNQDDDTAGITVTPTAGLVTTEGLGQATFTVVLTSEPTANVTIGLSSSDLTEGTVAPASVTFTNSDWSTAQTVTITGVNDALDDGDILYSIITAAATSTDPGYNGRASADVGVTNQDDDAVGITVVPTAGLVTTEALGQATFTIVLNSQPTANVTIGLSSSDLTEGTVAPPSVTFTSGDWSTAQTVTVTGVNDDLDDGNILYSILTAAATSADAGYNGLDAADVGVTNQDDDTAGITVTPTAGLVTTEAGGTAGFTVVLSSQPTANVTIGFSSSDLTEGTVAPASLTFTLGDWATPQPVTITGVDDLVADGSVAYTIVTAAATSPDPSYNGFDPADVTVSNTDDDAVAVTVTPTTGLVTTEAGDTATFTVVLGSQPTADVTIGISSSDVGEGTASPASLTFTTGDWASAQTVTITGVNDAIADGAVAYSIVTAAAASADPGYNGFDPADVAVSNTDDDAVGITVNPTAGLVTSEAGDTATFTVVLRSQPTADVTIGLASSDLSEGTIAVASLTFTTLDWAAPQTVTVTGVDDAIADGTITYTIITAAAASADPGYNGLDPADVAASNTDDDVVAIIVNPSAGLVTTEAGGQATFTVVLGTQPAADVTIGLSCTDLSEGTIARASLTFTSGDWATPQTVTVTGADDGFVDGSIAYSIITAAAASADPDYNGLAAADVAVSNTDDDTGFALQLELSTERDRVEIGQPVSYLLVIRNLTATNLSGVSILNQPPSGFGYLEGSAARDGRGIPDPLAAAPQEFVIDTLGAFVDLDGDGRAGPGESGYATLRWQLVPGAGAAQGDHIDAAVAVQGCATCVISNRAEAKVRVEPNALFANGTVLGRVFEDVDRDGRQGHDERGVPGARVALDDGTSVLTDAEGRFHLPNLEAGPRAFKLDLAQLGLPATPTTDAGTVVNVSPGLLASVRFGVSFSRDTVDVGRPPVEGLAIVTEEFERAVDVTGNALMTALIVNGRAISVRSADARLAGEGATEILRLAGDRLETPAAFQTEVHGAGIPKRWRLEISQADSGVGKAFEGSGVPPSRLEWNGSLSVGQLQGGQIYGYRLSVEYADGSVVEGPRRVFGVNRRTSIAMTMTGDAFVSGRSDLSPAAHRALAQLAKTLRRSPGELVVVEGHTDSVGSAADNLRLSQERAEAAVRFLVQHERIPSRRLVARGYGEDRPVASSATTEGRELNRRIEINGQQSEIRRARLYDVYRGQASARVGALEVAVDSSGRFACRAPAASETLDVTLTDRQGRISVARVRLPALEILAPKGEVRLPFGESLEGVGIEPRAAFESSEPLANVGGEVVEQTVARVRLRGRTNAGNRVEVDGAPVAVEPDGSFTADLALHIGENTFGVVARNPTGVLRVANVVVRALDRDPEGQPLVVVESVPEMTLFLPPKGAVLGNTSLTVAGRTRPGHRVTVNGDTLAVAADGSFTGQIQIPEGKSRLLARVEDPRGTFGIVERELDVHSKRLFLVALADGMIGRTQGAAYLQGRGGGETWTEGRIAYHLKGWIAGRYLVTSAFDTQRRDFASLFRDLDDAGRDRLLVNLDPDKLYPVYGDSSAIAYGAPGGGRFFLAVEGEALRAAVGDFPIAFDEVELASFHRTLYGAQLRLGRTAHGETPGGTSIAAFAAEARHVRVRDEIQATGGTLYYLSHTELIEGSVQVSLVVRDRDTGLPLARIPQQRGIDYTVKEFEGRVMFSRPIPSVWDDGSLVDGAALRGHPVTLEADYETRGSFGEKAAAGGRISQALGPVTVGGTVVDDASGSAAYRLFAGDAKVRLGASSWLGVEAAESEGRSGQTFLSADGGLRFAASDTAAAKDGQAWKAAGHLDVGSWLGRSGAATLGGYFKRVESGFVSDAERGGRASNRFGLRSELDGRNWGRLSARFDRESRPDLGPTDSAAVRATDLLGVQWRRDGVRAGTSAEFEQRLSERNSAEDQSAQTGALRLWWRPFTPLRATLERQQSFGGAGVDQTALGLDWRVLPVLTLEGRGVEGDAGRAVRGGATLSLSGRQLYLREEHQRVHGGWDRGTIVGLQAPLGAMSRAYSEYRWQQGPERESAVSVLGLEQGWRAATGFVLRVAGEHGSQSGAGSASEHSTLSSDVSYRGRLPLSGSTRGEYRAFGTDGHDRQLLTATRLSFALREGLSLQGDYRLSLTDRRDFGTTPARFEESSIGLSYRPPRPGLVEGLARWTRLADRRDGGAGDTLTTESLLGVAALEATVRPLAWMEWTGKGAARVMRDARGTSPSVAAHSALWASRVDLMMRSHLRLGLEYRLLSQREVGDRLGGWLQELSWDPATHLRLGVGYNFSRLTGNPLDRDAEDAHGWFLRAQSRY